MKGLQIMKLSKVFFAIVIGILIFPSLVGAQESIRPPWPKITRHLPAIYVASSSANIPVFPRSMAEYRDTGHLDYWDNPSSLHGTIRLFDDGGWTIIPEFPYGGNSCESGLFMLRWRAANSNVLVASNAAFSPEPSYNDEKKAKKGSFGYMVGSACEQPLFKFAGLKKNDGANVVDLYYEVKFWRAAP